MADFTGFYLDGIHSSTYGILRVSDGDRYTEGLIPEFEDYSIELTGGNGDLYGGRRYKPTKFTIPIVFDHMTEQQLRNLRQCLGKEELKAFRFDERPYKTYWVKTESKPELEYICFMENKIDGVEGEKERIYKGEGKLNFIAYDPFGYCIDERKVIIDGDGFKKGEGVNWQELRWYVPFRILDDNLIEWASASGLKNSLEEYNTFAFNLEGNVAIANLYNPGDFPTDFKLYLKPSSGVTDGTEMTISLYLDKDYKHMIASMTFLLFIPGGSADTHHLINTKNHSLLFRFDNPGIGATEMSLYCNIQKGSQWFKIPTGASYLKIQCDDKFDAMIEYNYKYY